MTTWQRARLVPLGAEVALAFLAGAATFTVAAVVVDAADSDALIVLLGVVYLVGVVATFRFLGVAYAVPAAMAGLLAYDWFHLAPTHALEFPDSANLLELLTYLGVVRPRRRARRERGAPRGRLRAGPQRALRRAGCAAAGRDAGRARRRAG